MISYDAYCKELESAASKERFCPIFCHCFSFIFLISGLLFQSSPIFAATAPVVIRNTCKNFLSAESASRPFDEGVINEAFESDPARLATSARNRELNDRAMREAYENDLSANGDLAVLSFAAWSTIARYRGGGYLTLNPQMRSGQISRVNEVFARGLAAALRILSPTRSYEGIVYRYLKFSPDELQLFLQRHGVGKVTEEVAFTSTNKIPFKDQSNLQLIIKSHRGIDISFEKLPPPWDQEQEVLFSPGAKFKVNKLTRGNPIASDTSIEWTLEMEQVP